MRIENLCESQREFVISPLVVKWCCFQSACCLHVNVHIIKCETLRQEIFQGNFVEIFVWSNRFSVGYLGSNLDKREQLIATPTHPHQPPFDVCWCCGFVFFDKVRLLWLPLAWKMPWPNFLKIFRYLYVIVTLRYAKSHLRVYLCSVLYCINTA